MHIWPPTLQPSTAYSRQIDDSNSPDNNISDGPSVAKRARMENDIQHISLVDNSSAGGTAFPPSSQDTMCSVVYNARERRQPSSTERMDTDEQEKETEEEEFFKVTSRDAFRMQAVSWVTVGEGYCSICIIS